MAAFTCLVRTRRPGGATASSVGPHAYARKGRRAAGPLRARRSVPVHESFLHVLYAALPEFVGSLMSATVLIAVGWSARKVRERRSRRDRDSSLDR